MTNKHGGKRPNAGRKYKYGEPTEMVRVPVSLIPKIQKMINKLKVKK